jgi:alginate O-acetyltransferase complex protein AlgI
MSFQSLHFFVFLTAVILLNHRLAGHAGLRKNMLLFASYYFYLCWDWRFAMLLIFVTLVNFVAGAGIATARHPGGRRLWMGVAVAGSLGVLAYFKYANFFIESIAGFARSLGFEADLPLLQVVLPIGISFFTFQSLTYPLDIYRGTKGRVSCGRKWFARVIGPDSRVGKNATNSAKSRRLRVGCCVPR